MPLHTWWTRPRVIVSTIFLGILAIDVAVAQQTLPFGGAYSGLDPRRQQLVNDWVGRFVKTTGQALEPGPLYDEFLTLSTKTTFEAVTHALVTMQLTDASGASLGDALALVERVESVRGDIRGAPGDRQFRMFVRLTPEAVGVLARSQQFKRRADNSVYHKGYPTNYRGQGGVPSIQISIAVDGRRADIDVDYRSAMFPVSLLNGHLSASNSDVRAGNNFERHNNRWTGFQNWWQGFFGGRQERASDVPASDNRLTLPKTPRVGSKNIDVMVNDFLKAWLVEGDIIAAMGYVSERSYACLAQESDNPWDFDRGTAPFQLMINLKSAADSLGKQSSLEGLIVGTRLVDRALRVVRQPHHAQFVIYSVPDDVAAAFDCESRLTLEDPANVGRTYGNYFGATFYVNGRRGFPLALLWARDGDYWKIISWKVGSDEETTAAPEAVPDQKVVRINADSTLVEASRGFLESWLVRKDYDAAFGYLSPKAYQCYNLERGPEQAAATSLEDGGRKLHSGLEATGKLLGTARTLEATLAAPEPSHPALRVMDHRFARVFSLTSVPNALADAMECAARANVPTIPDPLPLEYGDGFGMTVRFKTRGGDPPVLRLLWRKENNAWRVTSYSIEMP